MKCVLDRVCTHFDWYLRIEIFLVRARICELRSRVIINERIKLTMF